MLYITTVNGQILTDQRGNYLYDGRQGEPVLIQEPLGPVRWSLKDMLKFWATYSEYGSYELHLW
jgi:hypothetical protein